MNRVSFICISMILVLTVALASCSGTVAPELLTTSTILADVARNVAGDRLTVGSLLPAGADPHSYQLTPQDTAKISKSKVLVINGAGYERFLEVSLASAEGSRTLIDASTSLPVRSEPENGQGADPHLWLDPTNVIVYAENIRDGLSQFDPAGADLYRANASVYIAQLEELGAWINGQITQIPPARRLLVTNHEALGYFAEKYGFTVVGTVIESFSSDASPSAEQMAALVEQIKLYEAPAIFLDAADNPALAQQIAAETGVQVVTDLHIESLTDGAPAATYIEMMKHNVTRMIEVLR